MIVGHLPAARAPDVGQCPAQQLMQLAGDVVVFLVRRTATRAGVLDEAPEELEWLAVAVHRGGAAPLRTGRVHWEAAGMGHGLVHVEAVNAYGVRLLRILRIVCHFHLSIASSCSQAIVLVRGSNFSRSLPYIDILEYCNSSGLCFVG
jgi:hypothetical protein